MTQTTAAPSQTPLASQRLPLPPGPRGHWLWGMLPDLRRDLLGMYRDVARQYGDVARVPFMGVNTYAVSHPDHFKHILQDNNRNYRRNTFFNAIVKEMLGLNLFTADGDEWLSRRRLMQPAFHRQRIAGFAGLMTECTGEMLARWERVPAGQVLAMDQEMMALTLRIAGRALFSVDLSRESSALGDAFTDLSEYVNYRFGQPFPPPRWVPTRRNRLTNRAAATIDRTIAAMIRERRASGADQPDLLGMLMQARDADTGQGMTDAELHNEIGTMMFAGHETTATALTWTFYLLSQNPDVERRLHAEVDAALGGRIPTMADLPNLPYARRVIDEALRLYPPAWGVTRQSVDEDELGGYRIPADASVSLIIINVHHDPRFWDDPERFDPDRFTPERAEGRPAFAYLPFGAGPRLCIGNQFALTEAHLVLAAVAARFALRLVPGHPVKPNPIFVLRTSNGLPMTLVRR